MKFIISAFIAFFGLVSVCAAATGSTSTGSTSTGSTSTGTVSPASNKGAGGATVAYNYALARMDLYPQCFPWIFASEYFTMNIGNMYYNQDLCRKLRLEQFGF